MSNRGIEGGPEKNQTEKRGFFRRIYQAMSAGMAMLAFAGPIKDSNNSEKAEKIMSPEAAVEPTTRPESWLEINLGKSEGPVQRKFQWPEFRATFFEGVDERGNAKFNIWSLIAALQVEIPFVDKSEGKVTIQLPFEYARLFAEDAGSDKPLNPDDLKKAREFIDHEFKNQFAEILYGWDWSKKVYGHSKKEKPENMILRSIEVTGTASPEGPQTKGPETITPGNIDPENIALAMKRGRAGLSLSKEWLERSGVNLRQLEDSIFRLQAKELQFTETELLNLENYASRMPGHDDMERIFNLIQSYNQKTIQDRDIIDRLDQLVGAKRMVEITINYEKNENRRILIPIPLLPIIIGIALPGLIRRRNMRKGILESFSPMQNVDLPPQESPKYQEMLERTIIDDLGIFFDNKETIGRGLNYRKLTEDASRRYADSKDDGERELHLAREILEAWKIHDTKCRQEAGFDHDHLEAGLDYENQPHQIKWARMHARALIGLISENRKSGKDYRDALDGKISEMLKKKGER